MATRLPPVDAVIVGFGWTAQHPGQGADRRGPAGARARARRLSRHGARLRAPTHIQDELRYAVRNGTLRAAEPRDADVPQQHRPDRAADAPPRLVPPGAGAGGAGVHWNGQTWRFLPTDFLARSHITQRYGAGFIPDGMTIQDWGVTYDELEPYYDRFEYLCGVSGKAGNLNGSIQAGGNPFEGPRRAPYPLPPLKRSIGSHAVRQGRARNRRPSVSRARRPTRRKPYKNLLRRADGQVHVLRLLRVVRLRQLLEGEPADYVFPVLARASDNFELRTQSEVTRVNLDAPTSARDRRHLCRRRRAASSSSRPTSCLLCAYAQHNVHLLLLSGIGKPYDPKAEHRRRRPQLRLPDHVERRRLRRRRSSTRSWAPARSARWSTTSTATTSTTGRTASSAAATSRCGPPAGGRSCSTTCPRARRPGASKWKRALAENYLHSRQHRDARQRDELSRRLPRSRPDLPRRLRQPAAAHDVRLPRQRAPDVGVRHRQGGGDREGDEGALASREAAQAATIRSCPTRRRTTPAAPSWAPTRAPASSTATCSRGTCRTCSCMGACAFPQNAGYNPTGTVGALRSGRADAIRSQYLQEARAAASCTLERRGASSRRRRILLLAGGVGALHGLRQRRPMRARLGRTRRSCAAAISSRAGDCAACHTADGGQPFAGGRAVPTPFGTIYSSNITPDDGHRHRHMERRTTSGTRCTRACSREGKHLYPAFPYPWYTKLTRDDVRAIKAYLDTLPAGRNDVREPELPWPLSWRSVSLAGMERAVLRSRRLPSNRAKSRAVEPRRISRRRPRPLRRMPFAEELAGRGQDE